jgi:hypothetical protein
LKALGIAKVFDLRSDTEIQKYKSPLPNIEGVEVLRTPVFRTEDYSPEMMAKYVRDVLHEVSPYIGSLGFRRFQLYASGKTEVIILSLLHAPTINYDYRPSWNSIHKSWTTVARHSALFCDM